jgi:phosphomannomutase
MSATTSSESSLLSRASLFTLWDPNPITRTHHASASSWSSEELTAAFGSRLEFGTAGLRAAMGVGSSRMNEVTVTSAAQGLIAHLLATEVDACARGIVIGYDHRAMGGLSSRRFALATAVAAVARGVRVAFIGRLAATPLVAFAVRHLNAVAGVQVTASHNPKADNGYKVYAANGAQIVSPADKHIAASIIANEAPWDAGALADALDGGAGEAALLAHPLVRDPTVDVLAAYIAAVKKSLWRVPVAAGEPAVHIAYTAMHGVGTPYVLDTFAAWGLPAPTLVTSQTEPDPEFPTVIFPNPEEAGALDAACATADASGATLVIANDPDADRLAAAEWIAEGTTGLIYAGPRTPGNNRKGQWRVFSGNQVGALLAGWTWEGYVQSGGNPCNALFSASTVSSGFVGALAAKEGAHYVECLTGFKHMGNAMAAGEAKGLVPVFSFEEALGFSCGNAVYDKDGVSAAAVLTQMARAHAAAGRSLGGALALLYSRYGARAHNNGYVFATPPVQAAIFTRLFNEGHYWARLGGLKVERIRDLKAPGYDSSAAAPNFTPVLPTSSSNMMTLTLSNGVVATLRGSGTEPKLKWYAEGTTQADVDAVVTSILDEIIQPEVHGVARPKKAL